MIGVRLAGAALLLAAVLAGRAGAEPLPADAGIVDVRSYGAHGNGKDDDTQALLRAIAASGEDTGPTFWHDRIVYLPDGIYLVSDTLLKRYGNGKFASGLMLMGQSRAHTIIRLTDHAAGFGDARHPKPVIFTSSKQLDGTPTSGGKDYLGKGEGNDAYMNFVEDLTVEIGTGDPGAVAIDYLANNIGAVRNVTLHAPSGSGAVGLSMLRKWPGPALIQDVSIEGFAIGIATAQTEYGLTFEHISLADQSSVALRNDQNVLSICDLRVTGSARPIANIGDKGFLAIEGGDLGKSGARITDAVDNHGTISMRGVRQGELSGVLQGPAGWSPNKAPSWVPKVADRPPVPKIAPPQWANVQKFGAVADPAHDLTDGFRRAFASGAAIIYMPNGIYAISDAVEVPAMVQRIVGMNSTIKILPKRLPAFSRTKGMFRIDSAGPPIAIERLAFDNSNQGAQVAIEASGPRDVTVRDAVGAGVTLVSRTKSGGRAFIEDVCCGKFEMEGAAPVFARQLDTEGGGTRIVNHGSPFWVLGIKTEGVCTVIDNRDGARTDIFGGLLYMVRDPGDAPLPAFRNAASGFAGAFAEELLRPASRYRTFLVDEHDGQDKSLDATGFPERGFGRVIPDMTVAPRKP